MSNVVTYSYEDEMKTSFRDYATSVIVSRALPDVRDGFKPVQRRILYAMNDLGILPKTPYKKSARIVGEVIGKYHPHGDTAVYDTMVRLSQDFRMKCPLVDGHGNFGSIDGDGAAAMRYTEARLSSISNSILSDLEKNVVDYRDNYDGSEKEPVLLPTKFPQLLVNGYMGIAVGMRGNVPPHNVEEVINAFIAYTKKKNAKTKDLLKFISAPDYPTGGILINPKELKKFYETGEGRAVIRSKIELEDAPYGKTNIVVTEIPYTLSGNKTKLVNDLTLMVLNKELNELTDVRDESSKDGIRIVLEVKKGVNIDRLLEKLYSKTRLQDSESYQFLALVDGKPMTVSLSEYFYHYLEFQKEINVRKYRHMLKKSLSQKERLDGLIKAVDEIDVIVDIVRNSTTLKQMEACLTSGKTDGINFRLKKHEKEARKMRYTKKQAQSILDLKLHRLGALEVDKLKSDHKRLLKEIESYEEVLNNPKEMIRLIQKEHQAFKKNFSTPRLTKVEEKKVKKYVEKKKVKDVCVTVDRYGYIKVIDQPTKKELKEIKSDRKYVFKTNTKDRIVAFTNRGNLYQVRLDRLPKKRLKGKGVTLQALAGFDREEHILYVSKRSRLKSNQFIFVSSTGHAKRVDGKELISNRTKVLGTKLDQETDLTFVKQIDQEDRVTIQSKLGYVGQFELGSISKMGKQAKGVITLNLKDGDTISNVWLTESKKPETLLINGKDVLSSDIKVSARNVRGKKN